MNNWRYLSFKWLKNANLLVIKTLGKDLFLLKFYYL